MRCLVLGGGGFMGSHLVDALLGDGHSVVVLDRPNLQRFRTFKRGEDVHWIEGDALNPAEWYDHARGADVLYHLVTTTLPATSNAAPEFDVESNLVRTLRILEAAREAKIRRIVFASSGGTVYGTPQRLPIDEGHTTQPLSSYAIVKLAVEKYLELYRHLHGLEYRALRIANPYGERQNPRVAQGAVAVFLHKALRGETIEIWGDGSTVRDFVYVKDVARAMVLAGAVRDGERVLNIGSGCGTSILDLIERLEAILQRPITRRHLPARGFDVPISVLDVSRAATSLGWRPEIDLDSGLRRTLGWVQDQSAPRRRASDL